MEKMPYCSYDRMESGTEASRGHLISLKARDFAGWVQELEEQA